MKAGDIVKVLKINKKGVIQALKIMDRFVFWLVA